MSEEKTEEVKVAETAQTAAEETLDAVANEKSLNPEDASVPESKETELEKKLVESELKLAEAAENRLRLLADMENLRKRCSKDVESARINSTADTLMPFLQVYDHFKMAVDASAKTDNLKTLLDGMKMIEGEFSKAFDELSVERIDATGKDFDPNLHEAVSQEPSETVPAGKVIRQWSCGAKIPQRLIKPAMVIVSSGAPEKKEEK